MESPAVTPPLKFVLEALLFAAQKPLTPKELKDYLQQAAQDETAPEAAAFKKVREDDLLAALAELEQDHQAAARSYRLACVGGSWQFVSQPEFAPWLRALLGKKPRPPRLSQPAVETLTIIAYRQPVTRAEIEQIRGVNVDGVMQTLLERGLVVAAGRAEVVGRPVTYATTPAFLEYFGIRALEDLPAADELRRLPVQKPEALLTVDPGLATAAEGTAPPQTELPLPATSETTSTPASAPAPSETPVESADSPAPPETPSSSPSP
ncbi:MAG: SMC-Scp complex subunit ScpB [Verrucomicrobiales bacterium]|nr:SMC-Scp complex subunit ScpB [Verrucomicrobiales bacterium]